MTADVISSERREGTLGLLLLTRVSAFDVLVGKLGSAGLTSLCGLVAFLPMLMIPVLAGGVTGGEVFRKGLALPNALFFALAAGLWASARGRQLLKTVPAALLLVAAVVLLPGLAELLLARSGSRSDGVGLFSPLGTMASASDLLYKRSPGDYWISLGLVQVAGWMLVVAAVFRLRRGWREDRGETTMPAPAVADGCGVGAVRPASRPLGEDENPIAWLLQRQRGTLAILWAAAFVGFAYHSLFPSFFRILGPSVYSGVAMPLSLARIVLESALFAWAASRFFVEARRTGELELLLTTPMGAKQIVSIQWGVLKRMLRWPVLLLVSPVVARLALWMLHRPIGAGAGSSLSLQYAANFLFGTIDIVFVVGALCWVGLWCGLKAGGQGRAIVWSVGLVKGLPVLLFILWWVLLGPMVRLVGSLMGLPVWIASWLAPDLLELLFYIGLIQLVRRSLLGSKTLAEPTALDLRQSISSAARDAVAAIRRARHWTPA